ncbi:MAG: RNA polymerase sigma factor [Cyclobacteriaceae bacterium]
MLFRKSYKALSDEELMEKAQGGNDRALEEIYQRYSQPLLRYFFRMLWQDRDKAEDFLHDVFIKILEKPEHFDPTRKFSTWIYSVAHNRCKNEYRKQAFQQAVNGHSHEETIHEKVSGEMDHRSFQLSLEEILKTEDEETRTMFVMRYELEMNSVEIAEIVKCPEGTVRTRLFNLRKRLATKLDHYKVMLEK